MLTLWQGWVDKHRSPFLFHASGESLRWPVGSRKRKKRGKTYIHGCEMVVSGVEVKADSPCPPPSSAIFPDQGTPVARIHLLKSQQTQKLLFYFKKICDCDMWCCWFFSHRAVGGIHTFCSFLHRLKSLCL